MSLLLSIVAFTAVQLPGGGELVFRADGPNAEVAVKATPDGWRADVKGDATNCVCEVRGERPDGLYFGNGWYVKKPGRFSVGCGGHQNGTRFDGFDLADGSSLVMASKLPINELYVKPQEGCYGIRSEEPTTFTVVTGRQGAFECAIRFRDKYLTEKAAAGVKAKAGRFCIDAWNGKYGQHADFIEEAATKYGLKDDLLFYSHNWQRWGYDYRLPDVWPPNSRFGTKEEMYRCLKTAEKYGWGFGLHLNVSDFYDDSTVFTLDNVAKDANGKPQKAWYNAFMKAQSYRMLPDYAPVSIRSVMEEMNDDGFKPDTMFVDVIGSFPARPYWDKNGKCHPSSTAVKHLCEVFDIIRDKQTEATGRQAYTSSEAAADFMVGHLDGGDCQFMVLGTTSGEYRWMRIAEAEKIVKVPWFDAVWHSRFSLHGAGYSIRFEGGRGEDCHGIDSDDYLSVELMTGHALMTDAYSRDVKDVLSQTVRDFDTPRVMRQVVRCYWLAQHIIREIALDDIASVEFAGGDPERQIIVWKGGMRICVNRGKEDWRVDGVVLPQYGFLARSGKTGAEAMIARFGKDVAECSSYRDGKKLIRYVNPRSYGTAKLLPYTPKADVSFTTEGKISVALAFDPYMPHASRATQGPYTLSLWLVRPKTTENNNTLPDHLLGAFDSTLNAQPSTFDFQLPPKANGNYDVLVSVKPTGLAQETNFDETKRLKLLGTPSFFKRYHLGRVNVGQKTFTPFIQEDVSLWPRLFAPQEPVDFGWVKTREAFRLVTEPGQPDVKILLPGGGHVVTQ